MISAAVKEFLVEMWEFRKLRLYVVAHVLAPTMTPRGEIWIREVLVHWGMIRMVEVVS